MMYFSIIYALSVYLFISLLEIANSASIDNKQNTRYDKKALLQLNEKSVSGAQELLEFSKGRLKLTARITVGKAQKGKL